jgi:ribosomal protein S14
MARRSTQHLTEMSTSNFLRGRGDGAWGWQFYHIHVPSVLKSGSLNLLEPSLHKSPLYKQKLKCTKIHLQTNCSTNYEPRLRKMTEGLRQDIADGNDGKWGRKLEMGSKSVFFIYSNSVEFNRDVGKNTEGISHVCYMPRPYNPFDLHSLTGLSNGRRVFSVRYEIKLHIQRALTSVFKSEATPNESQSSIRSSRCEICGRLSGIRRGFIPSTVVSLCQVSFNQGCIEMPVLKPLYQKDKRAKRDNFIK